MELSTKETMDTYQHKEHRHRFAAWCAATAARSAPTYRFSVGDGFRIIEDSGLSSASDGWDALPEPENFDNWHRDMRLKVIDKSAEVLEDLQKFSHGVAAKLINCYLKALFLCDVAPETLSPQEKNKMNSIHPPVDRLLITGLLRSEVPEIKKYAETWRSVIAPGVGWSRLDSDSYENVIAGLRIVTKGELWRSEFFWPGYQH